MKRTVIETDVATMAVSESKVLINGVPAKSEVAIELQIEGLIVSYSFPCEDAIDFANALIDTAKRIDTPEIF